MIQLKHSRGYAAPGYETVQTLFEQHLSEGIEDRAQVCIYVKGIKVVDLFGTSPHTSKHERDTFTYDGSSIQNVFSSTKVLTSLVVAMLVDRGRLHYTQPVVDIWPEFGQNGKESTTVAQVMRHEAGLFRFAASLKATDLTAAKIKQGAVSDTIAAEFPEHRPGEKRVYHSMTRGWIVNEIVRRADLHQRTIGEFLQEEVGIPLGIENEMFIGTPVDRVAVAQKIALLKDPSVWWSWVQLLLPRGLGGGAVPVNSLMIRAILLFGIPMYKVLQHTGLLNYVMTASRWMRKRWSGIQSRKIESKNPVVLFEYPNEESFPWVTDSFNAPSMQRAEVPSANGHCSARAMAKVAASIVEGGALKGGQHCRILSKEGVKNAHGNPVRKLMFGIMNSPFTNAGWNMFEEKGKKGRDGFIGWMGLGGSVMQWHPKLRIGFAYAMNMLEITPTNERGRVLQEAAVLCAHNIENRERKRSRL